jgi:hypothetical protein
MRVPYSFSARTGSYRGRPVIAEVTGQGITPSACITATVQGGRACFSAPIIGQICLPAPGVPNLGQASACCDLSKTWGIPTGVNCCLKFRGQNILCKKFGL